MFTHIYPFAILAGAAVAGLAIAGQIGEYLERAQTTVEKQQLYAKVFMGVGGILFIVLGMAVIPLFLRFFTHMSGLIGNGDLALVKFVRENERTITYVLWTVTVVTFAFLFPDMIREGGGN